MSADAGSGASPDASQATPRTDARLSAITAAPVALLGLAVLAFAAWTGLGVRPAGEDYCAAWRTRDTGVLGIVHYFYAEFSGRITNAAVNAAVFSHGILGQRVLPGFLALALLSGTFLLLRQLLARLGLTAPVLVSLSTAVGISTLLLLGSEARYQVFFWAAGSLTHTLPAVIAVWAVVHGLAASRRGTAAQTVSAVLAACAAFATSTLNEAGTAVSGILALTAVALLLPQARRTRDWLSVLWPAAWLFGLLAGTVLLITSPGFAHRTVRPLSEPSLLSPAGMTATFGDFGRTWGTILGHTPAYLVALPLGVLLGLSLSSREGSPRPTLPGRQLVLPLALVLVSSLAVVAELRLGYGQFGWRFQRAYTNFLYPTLLALCFYGALLGRALRDAPRRAPVALAGSCLAVLGLVSLVPALVHTHHAVEVRRQAWDAQGAKMRAMAARGVELARYTPHSIDSLSEPFRMPIYAKDWAAHCAEHYYRIPSLIPSRSWLRSRDADTYRRVHPYALT